MGIKNSMKEDSLNINQVIDKPASTLIWPGEVSEAQNIFVLESGEYFQLESNETLIIEA